MMVRLLAVLLALCLAACATAVIVPDADALGVKVTKNIAYGALSAQIMDLCQPTSGPTTNRRAVLLLHPGGFTSGDKSSLLALCQNLASQGFVAATANYRLLGVSSPASDVLQKPFSDAQLALRFMRSMAATYGLDASHVCAYGYSAGGLMAGFLASYGSAQGDQAALLSSYSSRSTCSVMITGAYQSLNAQADASTAPTYIVAGTLDRNSLLAWNTAYYNILQGLGVTTKLQLYAGGHIWQGANQTLRAQIEQDIVNWMKQR